MKVVITRGVAEQPAHRFEFTFTPTHGGIAQWPRGGVAACLNRAIQGGLGHRFITSTAVYTALAPNRFRDLWRE